MRTSTPDRNARIVYFRVVEPDYPRNRRIRGYLTRRGHEVVVVPPATSSSRLGNHLVDAARLLRTVRRGDVVIVAEQYVRATPIAAIAARLRGCRLVVDRFVGIHETAVDDWQVAAPGSFRARRFRLQDWYAARAADCVLIDTEVRAAELRADTGAPVVIALPVGAPGWAVPSTDRPGAEGPLRVLYYGNYIPLHGIDVVLGAVARSTAALHLTLLGDGHRRPQFERLARELGIDERVTFTGAVAEPELAQVIAGHDVVLGVFGGSRKAQTVIANKTWQALACGRVVLTQRSAALDELIPVVGDQLRQVAPEPAALAAAFDALALRCTPAAPHAVAQRLETLVAARFEAFGDWLDGGTR